MRGCSAARSRIASSLECGLDPKAALELAHHLSACACCRAERDRTRSLSRQLDSLPEIDAPSGFTERVMRRLTAATPHLRRLGACVILGLISLTAIAATRIPLWGGALLPRLRLVWEAEWDSMLIGLGRAVILLLAQASGLFPSIFPARHAPGGSASAALPLALLVCLLALVLTVLLASSHPRRAEN